MTAYTQEYLIDNVVRFFRENRVEPTQGTVEFIMILAEFMMSGPEWPTPDLDAISIRLKNERLQDANLTGL